VESAGGVCGGWALWAKQGAGASGKHAAAHSSRAALPVETRPVI
jgi:hypothetical protein